MATIYTFPKSTEEDRKVYRLSLYTDVEVEAVLSCVNVFSVLPYKVTYENINQLDPRLVVECLEAGKQSWIFSEEFKKIFELIINNVQSE